MSEQPQRGRTLDDYQPTPSRIDETLPDKGGAMVPDFEPRHRVRRYPDETSRRGSSHEDGADKLFKPFPFALRKGDGGAKIHGGHFYYCLNGIGNPLVIHIEYLPGPPAVGPSQLATTDIEEGQTYCESQFLSYQLDWWGSVFLIWRIDGFGTVIRCKLSPTSTFPEGEEAGAGEQDFWVKIGSVPESGKIEQEVGSDIWWYGSVQGLGDGDPVRGRYGVNESAGIGETILDFDGINVGNGAEDAMGPDDVGVLVDAPDPLVEAPAKLRSFAGREYYTDYSGEPPRDDAGISEQIDMVQDGNLIRTIGNGKVGSLTISKEGESDTVINWNDGLVTTSGDFAVEIPVGGGVVSGANLNLTVRTISIDLSSPDSHWVFSGTDPYGETTLVTHYWRNGLYVGTTDPEDEPEDLVTQEVSKIFWPFAP